MGLNPATAHRSKSSGEIRIAGYEYLESSGSRNYGPEGTAGYAVVSGQENEQAWALYGLAGLTDQRPISFAVSVEPAARQPNHEELLPLQYWCAVSNYTRYCWQWWGPFTESATIPLNSKFGRDRYVSETDQMFIAVLTACDDELATDGNAHGHTAADIQELAVQIRPVTDSAYYSTRPHYPQLVSAQASGGDQPSVLLKWEHLTDSASIDNEAFGYSIYRRGPGDLQKLLLGHVAAPATAFADPTDADENVLEPISGLHYTYLLTATNQAGVTPAGALRTQVPPAIPGQHQLVITEYEIRMAGARGGLGAIGDIFGPADLAGAVVANSPTTLTLEAVGGVFDGGFFKGRDPEGWPPGLAELDYQAARSAASNGLYWYLQNRGADGFRRSSDWLILDSGTFPLTGNPASATVFADSDPESDSNSPEGRLITYLPTSYDWEYLCDDNLRVHVVYAIQYSIDVDVLEDQSAPRLLNYLTPAGDSLECLYSDQPTELRVEFEWGENGLPSSLEDTALQLNAIMSNNSSLGPVVELTYVEGFPLIDQYCFLSNQDDLVIGCEVSDTHITDSGDYVLRFKANGFWTSINEPSSALEVIPAPSIPDISILPDQCSPSVDVLQVFLSEPRIRRNPIVFYSSETKQLVYENPMGFSDTLKPNGDEFAVSYSDGMFPRVAIIEGMDPEQITSWQDSIPGVFTFEQNPNKIWVDIAAITPEGASGDPMRSYAYRIFNEDGSTRGGGTLMVSPVNTPIKQPFGLGWGVNVFNRDEKLLSDREYTNSILNGDTVDWNSPAPDVLWFEVSFGWMFDSPQNATAVFREAEDSPTDNLAILVQDAATGAKCYLGAAARTALLDADDSYLLIHALTPSAFAHPTDPDWAGIFSPGHEYILALDDPHWAGIEFEYQNRLAVTGSNPNDP